MSPGKLIVFEGGEGAGKSTQIRFVAERLRESGHEVLETREPGGTELGAQLRQLVMTAEGTPPVPLVELLLYVADRAQHVAQKIRPALHSGSIVLCDRFSASTIAYQGYARGLDLPLILQLDALARDGIEPDLTVLLDCPVTIGLSRARGSDRFHREERQFHERVHAAFLSFAKQDQESGRHRYHVVDSTLPREQVSEQVMMGVLRCLATN